MLHMSHAYSWLSLGGTRTGGCNDVPRNHEDIIRPHVGYVDARTLSHARANTRLTAVTNSLKSSTGDRDGINSAHCVTLHIYMLNSTTHSSAGTPGFSQRGDALMVHRYDVNLQLGYF